MTVDPKYSIQQSSIFLDFSTTPVIKIKVLDSKTGLSSTGYGNDVDNAKENAFRNLKIKEEKFSGNYFALYNAKGQTISGSNSFTKINQKV